MTLYFCYSLTTTWNPTFGYIKWTPYVALTISLLNIVSGRYVRQGMGRKTDTKYAELVCFHQFSLWNIAQNKSAKNQN